MAATREINFRPRVFCMEWVDPIYCRGHWVPEMVRIAGGIDKLAHEGIETEHIVHMAGLVTPISAIMIDPSGERTIVTSAIRNCGRSACLRSTRCWTIAPPF